MTLAPLLQASPAIQLHAFTAIAAFALGAVVIFRRKGDRLHRLGGRIWVVLMLVVAISSFFIHTIRMWGIWSPIHLLSIGTLGALAYAVWMIRRRNVVAHASAMRATYVGALVIAGAFTLAPGRIMNKVVFGGGSPAQAAAVAPPLPAARHVPGMLDIVTHTPLWVWGLLAVLAYVGWMRTRDRIVSPWRLFLMPVIVVGLAVDGIATAGLSPAGLLACACGIVAGTLAGLAVGRRRPAEWVEGGLRIRGDWMPLVLMAGVFGTRYVQGVIRSVDPALAHDPSFVVAGVFVSALFASLMLARTCAQLPSGVVRLSGGAHSAR